jgi:apolipoprotein N-acyltransferase
MKLKLGHWGVIGLTFIYVFIMTLYFEYFINRNCDETLQLVVTFLALMYTVFQIRLIAKLLTNFINQKTEKND